MARTKVDAKLPHNIKGGTLATSADFEFTGGEVAEWDGYEVPLTGREIILVQNTDSEPHTVSFLSSPDSRTGRVGDIEDYPLGAGDFARFGPFPIDGWRQPGGMLLIDVSDPAVEIAVLRS